MRRLAVDVMAVVALLALSVVVTFWARSYFFPDILDSYHEMPAPEPGTLVPWGARREWRERTALSFPGRVEWVSVRTVVRERWQLPAASQPTLPASKVNGWWLYPRRSLDWRPSNVPRPDGLWAGFGVWRESNGFTAEAASGVYRETREADAWGVSLPYWAPAAALVVLPGYRFVAAARGRRLRQFAYRLLVVSSSLLLLAIVGAWLRSYQLCYVVERSETFRQPASETVPAPLRVRSLRLYSVRGSLTGFWRHQHPGGTGPWVSEGPRYDLRYGSLNQFIPGRGTGTVPDFDRFGFSLWVNRTGPPRRPSEPPPEASLTVPYWLPVIVAGTIPSLHAARLLRQRRRERLARRGLCRWCGYDLRAGHTRCPECGHEVSPPAGDAAAA